MSFLLKAHRSFLEFTNPRQHFRTMLGAVLDSDVTNRKHTDVSRVALNRPQKWTPIYRMRGDPRR